MKCPYCDSNETKVVDKRETSDGTSRRRRECLSCKKRFTTYENIEPEKSKLNKVTKIKKRDGSIADFNQEKITNAIFKAAQSVGGKDRKEAEKLSDEVVKVLSERFDYKNIPEVEDIQDVVEKTLIENGHAKTAKAYILYREQHEKIRKTKSVLLDVDKTISEYLDRSDWRVKENSNEEYSFSGLLLHTSGKVIANYALTQIYNPTIREAYQKGYFHIHDLSHGFIGYCAGWSLKNLLIMGFGNVPNKVDAKPAKHMDVVVHQMVNYIGCLQMEFAGAQAFSSVDTLLAPFVRTDKLDYKKVKQAIQTLVFSLNIPSRWGCFGPEEYIFTSKGLIKIKDAQEKTKIATKNGIHTIKHKWENGKKDMFKLKTKMGYEVVATENHPFRDENLEFKELKDFKVREKIPISAGYNIFGNNNTVPNEEIAEIMGSIIGDGCIFKWKSNDRKNKRRKLSIYYDQKDKDVAERHLGILKKNGFSCTILKNRSSWMLTTCSNKAYDYFSKLGIRELKSEEKEIPAIILTAPKNIQIAFLRGIFEADGSVFYRGQISYTTISEKLAKQLKLILLNLGIFSNTMFKKPRTSYIKGRKIISKDVYEMRLAGNRAKLFKRSIGFVSKRKNLILKKEVKDLEHKERNLIFDEILSINPLGKLESYDLAINPDPEYVVNGFYVHNSQYPFSNLTFDWVVPEDMKNEKTIVGGVEQDFTYGDCHKEIDMVNKAFLEVMLEGDANGRIFTFPIPTYNLTKNFDWDSENAKLLFKLTAKYGLPYFQNYIGSNLDPKSIRAMCCRLNLDQNELMNRPGSMWGPGDNTGSIGVITINMNRLGYEAETEEEFFDKLKHYMTLGKDALEIKRKIIQKNLDNGLMPYTKAYLGTWDNHFSTIGLCGMNECCRNFLEKDISTKEGKEFTIKTLNFMRGTLKEFQKETGNLYNLEATPAESAAYRLAKMDKKYCPDIITAGEKEPYLTNSTQLPVDYTEDAIQAVEHQTDIQPLYTGGTIFHTFLGEKMSSGEACKNLVKKIAENTRLPYFSITPTFSICKEHGYIAGEKPICPKCGKETEVYSRIVGYFRPIKNWNSGKQEEFKDRLEFSEEKSIKHKLLPITIKAKT